MYIHYILGIGYVANTRNFQLDEETHKIHPFLMKVFVFIFRRFGLLISMLILKYQSLKIPV